MDGNDDEKPASCSPPTKCIITTSTSSPALNRGISTPILHHSQQQQHHHHQQPAQPTTTTRFVNPLSFNFNSRSLHHTPSNLSFGSHDPGGVHNNASSWLPTGLSLGQLLGGNDSAGPGRWVATRDNMQAEYLAFMQQRDHQQQQQQRNQHHRNHNNSLQDISSDLGRSPQSSARSNWSALGPSIGGEGGEDVGGGFRADFRYGVLILLIPIMIVMGYIVWTLLDVLVLVPQGIRVRDVFHDFRVVGKVLEIIFLKRPPQSLPLAFYFTSFVVFLILTLTVLVNLCRVVLKYPLYSQHFDSSAQKLYQNCQNNNNNNKNNNSIYTPSSRADGLGAPLLNTPSPMNNTQQQQQQHNHHPDQLLTHPTSNQCKINVLIYSRTSKAYNTASLVYYTAFLLCAVTLWGFAIWSAVTQKFGERLGLEHVLLYHYILTPASAGLVVMLTPMIARAYYRRRFAHYYCDCVYKNHDSMGCEKCQLAQKRGGQAPTAGGQRLMNGHTLGEVFLYNSHGEDRHYELNVGGSGGGGHYGGV